jgi:predicted transcriptional regulator
MIDRDELPIYRRIAEKVSQLRELGMSDRRIAQALGVSDKTVARAAATQTTGRVNPV